MVGWEPKSGAPRVAQQLKGRGELRAQPTTHPQTPTGARGPPRKVGKATGAAGGETERRPTPREGWNAV